MSRVKSILLSLLMIVASIKDAQGQVARVITLADTLVGGVGGVSVDRLGNIYAADFMDTVWRVKPDGRVSKFATGFYGASGNAFSAQGDLYQSNFYGQYISKIGRDGQHEKWVEEGLVGPVGLAFDSEGRLWVNNCGANTIGVVDTDRKVKMMAEGSLFNCPNGITAGPDGAMYVVNFSDGRMIRIDKSGESSLFALIPGGGNGHIAVARGDFYVTSFQSHRIFKVTMDGEVSHVAGTGRIGEVDGLPLEAVFTFPNGIAVDPNQNDRLFINDYVNRTLPGVDIPPVPVASLRMIKLQSFTDVLVAALKDGGIAAMEKTYRDYKSNPGTASVFTEIAVNALGYALMGGGSVDAAIRVFELNAESYPASFNAFDSLAEGFMTKGQNTKAIQFYQKSLELNPANQNATDMLEKIRSN